MSLPEDDRDSFECMIQWLYTKKFALINAVSNETSHELFFQLAKLNTLAEKYDIYLLKNDVVDALFDHANSPNPNLESTDVMKHVYDNTTRASSFRKLMVAWHAYEINLGWFEGDDAREELTEVSPEFAIELAIALAARLKHPDRRRPFNQPSSDFHEKPPKKVEKDQAQEGVVKEVD